MLTVSEIEADENAALGRDQILGVMLPRKVSRVVLRALQAVRLYPKA